MNIMDRFGRWFAEQRGFHVSQEPPGWVRSMGGWDTPAGVTITPENALEVGAVYACVRVLSESVAQLPLLLYQRLPNDARERATNHPLFWLLRYQPNPEMTAFEFRETLTAHLLIWGNAYAEIEFNRAGQVTALWPLRPDRMKVTRKSGQLRYTYTLPKPDATGRRKVELDAWRVLHLRGLGSNGIIGYTPIQLQRLGVGLARATEEYGARFFGNDARPGGVLEHPGELSDEAQTRLLDSWESRHGGLSKSHRLAILEEGMKFSEIGLPPEDAQFLQTRKYQRSEIAGWYRVPPHMIGDLERATFSNIEHQGMEFVTNSLGPWLVRWEQRCLVQLLPPAEQKRYFVEHLVASLLRGDIVSRYQAYAQGRQNGWLSANDIRQMENMNPVEGGDVYLVPLNMIPASEAGLGSTGMESEGRGEGRNELRPNELRPPLAPPAAQGGEEGRGSPRPHELRSARLRWRLTNAHYRVYRDVAARVLRREVQDVGAAARKLLQQRDYGQFSVWLADFYREHPAFVVKQFAPTAATYGELVARATQEEIDAEEAGLTPELEGWIRAYLDRFGHRHSAVSELRLREIAERALEAGDDPYSAIELELEAWEETRSVTTAQWESVRFGNALAKAVYLIGGIRKLRWVAFGKSCPYCNELNGKIVGIDSWFLDAGSEFQPEGAERPLKNNNNVGHAPAHSGCDCQVVAA